MSDLLTVTQAIAILDTVTVSPRVIELPLAEAVGMRLAEDLRTDRDFPPFDKSQMDGYAVRCADVANTPSELQVVAEIAAGGLFEGELQPGQAAAIMTGAPLPTGADGVVPVEETERAGEKIRILKEASPGRYIARSGSDALADQLVLPKKTILGPAQIAVAASIGARKVRVFRQPHVAVLSTGDELVGIEDQPGASQIRDSNSPMLSALLRKMGCHVAELGFVRDDPESIRAALREGLQQEVIFVAGGMSMGSHDYVPQIFHELGFQLSITKLRIKPGKPFVFGKRSQIGSIGTRALDRRAFVDMEDRFVFGLPGNPVSAFLCTFRLASRLLARMAGGEPREKWLAGRLDVGLPASGPREFYQPVIWSPVQGGTSARSEFASVMPLAWKGSADIFTLAKANAFLVRPENEPPLGKGTLVRVLEI